MIKKIMPLMLAAVLSISLLGCSKEKASETTGQTGAENAAQPGTEDTTSQAPIELGTASAAIRAFDKGKVDEKTHVYQNEGLGFSVTIPANWTILGEEDVKKADEASFGDQPYAYLLMAYDENGADETSAGHCDIRIGEPTSETSIVATLESQRNMYLSAIEEKGLEGITVGDVEERMIGNQKAYYLKIVTAEPVTQEFIAFEKNGIAVQLYYYWSNTTDGQAVAESIDSLQFNG